MLQLISAVKGLSPVYQLHILKFKYDYVANI